MMKRRWGMKVLAALLLTTAVLLVSEGWTREGPLYKRSVMAQITRKLIRGICNVGFGWCEVPRNIHIAIEDIDPFTGTIVGLFRGTGQAIVRTTWGVWEVLTFPIPFPSEYRAMVKPEVIWQELFEPPSRPLEPKEKK
ncbi:MAG: exosortase system-associated protein, TIGR04073 family [Candidatus Sumerlaeia bacterium]|nr:exosortase system-associated protein, TIGR04073 family [Candidatus Sumerlaeia bacterium]